jgi:hypothetical protein
MDEPIKNGQANVSACEVDGNAGAVCCHDRRVLFEQRRGVRNSPESFNAVEHAFVNAFGATRPQLKACGSNQCAVYFLG